MTEWSKVLRSGRSVFARVGSSPTACIFAFLFSTMFLLCYVCGYLMNYMKVVAEYILKNVV